jgi:hypothetical protein
VLVLPVLVVHVGPLQARFGTTALTWRERTLAAGHRLLDHLGGGVARAGRPAGAGSWGPGALHHDEVRGRGFELGVAVSRRELGRRGARRLPWLDRHPDARHDRAAGLPIPPSVAGFDLRAYLPKARLGKPYPAVRLGEDVLRGLARNRAIIVAPRSARAHWLLLRSSPRFADTLARRMTRVWREHAAAVTGTPPGVIPPPALSEKQTGEHGSRAEGRDWPADPPAHAATA